MKQFAKYIFIIILSLIVISYFLDFSFTYIYKNTLPRNKVALADHGEKENYDVIFLGSSRANNHFVPQLFVDKGYKSFNYGMSGSRLEESALQLQLLLEKGTHIQNIILEVDLNINSNGFSEGTRIAFYPYLKKSKSIQSYYDHLPEFQYLYNIPFYRYLKYETTIGFREVFFSALGKKASALQNYGFYALNNTGKNMSYDLSNYSPKINKGYEAIKKLCLENDIKLISVTTPMCQNINNKDYFDAVVKLYPEIHNLENVVTDEKCFSSCGHMNKKGAIQFTQYILNQFFH